MDTRNEETLRARKLEEIDRFKQKIEGLKWRLQGTKSNSSETVRMETEAIEEEMHGIPDELEAAKVKVAGAMDAKAIDDVSLFDIERRVGEVYYRTLVCCLRAHGVDTVGGSKQRLDAAKSRETGEICTSGNGMEEWHCFYDGCDRWGLCNESYWDLESLSSEVFDRWDEHATEKHIDFPLSFILRHYCCADVYYVHDIHILVVPLGNSLFLMATGDIDDLMHLCSAGCTNEEFNSAVPSFDLLYASKAELSGLNYSVLDELIRKEYIDGNHELCEQETGAMPGRNYARNIRQHKAFSSNFDSIIMDEYNPGGSGTYVNEVWIGRIAQPYFAQMIEDMKGCVGTIDPFST